LTIALIALYCNGYIRNLIYSTGAMSPKFLSRVVIVRLETPGRCSPLRAVHLKTHLDRNSSLFVELSNGTSAHGLVESSLQLFA